MNFSHEQKQSLLNTWGYTLKEVICKFGGDDIDDWKPHSVTRLGVFKNNNAVGRPKPLINDPTAPFTESQWIDEVFETELNRRMFILLSTMKINNYFDTAVFPDY